LDSTTQFLSIIIILITFVALGVGSIINRRRRTPVALRPIAAYDALPMQIGAAIEANRPVHASFGSAGIGSRDTALAVASAELFYRVVERASISTVAPILTMSDPTAIPLAYATLRRAYNARGLIYRYDSSGVRWFPAGTRSLAFAAALTGTLADDNVGTNVLVGSFGPELALIADAAFRRNQPLVAASDQLEGQAVAYALSDQPLIGEELFTAGAYLSTGEDRAQVTTVLTIDTLRWLLIIAMIVVGVFTALGSR
jgi:hypothetical protein